MWPEELYRLSCWFSSFKPCTRRLPFLHLKEPPEGNCPQSLTREKVHWNNCPTPSWSSGRRMISIHSVELHLVSQENVSLICVVPGFLVEYLMRCRRFFIGWGLCIMSTASLKGSEWHRQWKCICPQHQYRLSSEHKAP